MRIRTQLVLSSAIAVLVSLAVIAALVQATRQAQRGLDEQARSQDVVRQVANMLALTNELAVYGGDRVATQWHTRATQLAAAINEAVADSQPAEPMLLELKRNVEDLPPLFDKLVEIGRQPPTELSQRRHELLMERLLAETQEVVESRHRWALVIGEGQQRNHRFYSGIVLATPAALLLVLSSLGLLVSRRVLVPLRRLEEAAIAIQHGKLDVRCDRTARDELGDTARAVDAMALALQRSERRLRLITDSLPALICHLDRAERYTFVNAQFARTGTGDPTRMIGRTFGEVHGDGIYSEVAPRFAQVLAGEEVHFEQTRELAGRTSYHQAIFLPDVDDTGSVRGFYAMSFDITERKEAELRLAASERLLVEVTDNLPALVAYIDRDERYRFANSKYREWRGIDPATMIGRTVLDVMGEQFHANAKGPGHAALAGRRTRWEHCATVDDRQHHYLIDVIPDFGPDGEVRGFCALTIDITERKEAELRLAANERLLVGVTDNLPALVSYIDRDERYCFANSKYRQWLGLDPKAMLGRTVKDVLGDVYYATVKPRVDVAFGGERVRWERSTTMHDGQYRHLLVDFIPDFADDGKVRGLVVLSIEITELKEAQEAQARVERQLRAIADNLPVMIGHIDAEERYRFINATGCRMLGVDPGEAIGRRMAEVLGEGRYTQRQQHLQATLAGQRVEFVLEAQRGDEIQHMQTVYIPDVQPDGRIVGAYLLATDVTALKRSEQLLQQMARFDSLTGLPNRRNFEDRLKEAVARSTRERRPIAVMFLDIDHFKRINDTRGHGVGDLVLKEFAARLKNAVRATDMPARLAGDEFVVLLEGLHGEGDVTVVAEKLVAAIRKPFFLSDGELSVTTSVGIAYSARPRPNPDISSAQGRRPRAEARFHRYLTPMKTEDRRCQSVPMRQFSLGAWEGALSRLHSMVATSSATAACCF